MVVTAKVNGVLVVAVVDTGSTEGVVFESDIKRLGLLRVIVVKRVICKF